MVSTPPLPPPLVPTAPLMREHIDGDIDDLRIDGNGGIRVISADNGRPDRGHGTVRVFRTDADGRRERPRSVVRAPRVSDTYFVGDGATLMSTGSTVAYAIEQGMHGTKTVRIATNDRRGRRVALDRFDFPTTAFVADGQTAPNGAVLASGVRNPDPGSGTDEQPVWLALRPAGAQHFRRLNLSGVRGQLGDIIFAQDGSAIMLGQRSEVRRPWLRRISSAGAIGPELPLPVPPTTDVDVRGLFDRDGTFLAVMTYGKRSQPHHGIEISRLAPGSSQPTAPRHVVGSDGDIVGDVTLFDIDDRGNLFLEGLQRKPGSRTLTGLTIFHAPRAGASPALTTNITTNNDIVGVSTPTPGGGWTLAWPEEPTKGAGRVHTNAVHCDAAGQCGSVVTLDIDAKTDVYASTLGTMREGRLVLGWAPAGPNGFGVSTIRPWW